MTEREILNRLMIDASKKGDRLFRNNSGLGWVGAAYQAKRTEKTTLHPGDVVIRNARPLHAGLAVGSSDLIGWTRTRITPDMVGDYVAVFTAMEIKTGTVATTREQQNFIDTVKQAGGIAAIHREDKP